MTEPESAARARSRRRLLLGGLGLTGAYAGLRLGVPALTERLAPLEFEPLARPAGFRRLVSAAGASGTGGGSAGAFDPLIGLAPPAERTSPSCRGLFGSGDDAGAVPVAYFSDHNCAYCRVLEPRLDALDGTRLTRHEWPILGESSDLAARAVLAAGLQDARTPFQAALTEAPRPSPQTIARIAADLALDPDRLRADMGGPAVEAALARSRALAARFGLSATPALVVGRTLVVGAVGRVTLERLVAREAADGPVPPCA